MDYKQSHDTLNNFELNSNCCNINNNTEFFLPIFSSYNKLAKRKNDIITNARIDVHENEINLTLNYSYQENTRYLSFSNYMARDCNELKLPTIGTLSPEFTCLGKSNWCGEKGKCFNNKLMRAFINYNRFCLLQTVFYYSMKCYKLSRQLNLMQCVINKIKRKKNFNNRIRFSKNGDFITDIDSFKLLLLLCRNNPSIQFVIPTKYFTLRDNLPLLYKTVLPENFKGIYSIDSSHLIRQQNKEIIEIKELDVDRITAAGWKMANVLENGNWHSSAVSNSIKLKSYPCLKQTKRSKELGISCDKCRMGCFSSNNGKLIEFKFH